MTALLTALLTVLRADASLLLWLRNWLLAWLIAAPSIVWLAPRARRIAARVAVVRESGPGGGREIPPSAPVSVNADSRKNPHP